MDEVGDKDVLGWMCVERGEGTLFCSSLRHSSRACDTNLASLSAFIRRPRIRSASVRSNMAACAVVQVPCLRGVTGGTRRTAALPHCRPIRGCRLPTATSSTGMWRTLGDTAASRSYPVRQLREARMGRGTCGGTCGEGATDSAAILRTSYRRGWRGHSVAAALGGSASASRSLLAVGGVWSC